MLLNLRSGQSGALFVGENDGDTLLWDVDAGKFGVGPLPASVRVSSVFVVDVGSSAPIEKQTGSYSAPFSNVQDALDAAAESTASSVAVLLAPGFYQGEGALTFSANKPLFIGSLVGGLVTDAPAVAGIVYTGPELTLSGIIYGGLTVTGNAVLRGCKTTAAFTSTVSGRLEANECTWFPASVLTANSMLIQSSLLQNAVLNPQITQGCMILASRFATELVVNFAAGPGSLQLDSLSLYYWNALTGVVNNGSVVGLTPEE